MTSLLTRYRALSERGQKAVRIAGYGAAGLIVFVLSLYFTFPWSKATDRVAQALSQAMNMDVTIGDLTPTLWPGVTLHDLTLRTRPTMAGAKAATIHVDDVTVHPSLLAALGGRTDVSFSADLGGGTLSGTATMAPKGETHAGLTVSSVHLDQVTGLVDLDGVPLGGPLSGTVDLTIPPTGLPAASGTIDLTCDGCTVGDGVHTVKMPGAFGAGGFTLPRVRLGHLTAAIRIRQGMATIQTFHAKSPDGELYMEGAVALAARLALSQVQIYIRFVMDPALVAREASFQMIMGTMTHAKRADGFYGERLWGTFLPGQLRMMPSKDDFTAPLVPGRPGLSGPVFRSPAVPMPSRFGGRQNVEIPGQGFPLRAPGLR